MTQLKDIPTFGSKFGFAPVSTHIGVIPEGDRPMELRRWYFWKLNRPDTIVLISNTDGFITYGSDALKLAITIGRRIEYLDITGVDVPFIQIAKSHEQDLIQFCRLFGCDIFLTHH